jgi:deoxyribose-phosphate aldolase
VESALAGGPNQLELAEMRCFHWWPVIKTARLQMTVETIAASLDTTDLRLDSTEAAIVGLCEDALVYRFACAMVYPASVRLAARVLTGSTVGVGTVVGFPSGRFSTASKIAEIESAAKAGASEVDVVLNYAALREGRGAEVGAELETLVARARAEGLRLKVIAETCFLNRDQRMEALRLCEQADADFIKTSTGFGTAGAQLDHIRDWKLARSTNIQLKASGGIKTLAQVLSFLDAGATRIGTSSAVSIMRAYSGAVVPATEPGGDY